MNSTLAKWEVYSGFLLLVASFYVAQLPHYSFFLIMIIGWFLLVDGLSCLYLKKSFLHQSWKKIFIILVLGGGLLYGGFLEIGNLLAGTLWSYNQVDFVTLFIAHMLTLPTAMLTFQLLSASFNFQEKKKRVYHHKIIPLLLGLACITTGAMLNTNKIITYALFMGGYLFIIEFLVLLKKRTAFLERVISNPRLFIPIVLQALLSSLLVEGANNLAGAWSYHVLTYQVYGLYPLIMLGWIPLIIGLQSLYELVR